MPFEQYLTCNSSVETSAHLYLGLCPRISLTLQCDIPAVLILSHLQQKMCRIYAPWGNFLSINSRQGPQADDTEQHFTKVSTESLG